MKKKGCLICVVLVVVIALICAYFVGQKNKVNPSEIENPISSEQDLIEHEAVLYFASNSVNKLASEKRTVFYENKEDVYEAVIEALIKGPETDKCSVSINRDTIVNSVKVNDKVATVDFTSSFTKYNTGGSTKELLCLYSVVNTLCEFPEIDEVLITVDGKLISTFGQFDMSEPYTADTGLIEN